MSETRETCETCKFWSPELSKSSALKFGPNIGECRHHSPRGPIQYHWPKRQTTVAYAVSAFPPTGADDWCGEYQPASPARRAAL